MNQEFEHKT